MGSVIGWWAESFTTITARARALSTQVTVEQPFTASVATRMPQPRSAITGEHPYTSALACAMGKMTTAVAGNEAPQAAVVGQMRQASTVLTAAQGQSATVAAALKAVTAAVAAAQTDPVSATALIKQAHTAIAGAQAQSGLVTAVLNKALTAITAILPSVTFAAIGVGGSGSTINSNAAGTFTMNVTRATTRIFAIFQFAEDNTVTGYSATVGGQAMTLVTGAPFSHAAFQNVLVFEYINPAFGVTGHVEGTSTACVINGSGFGHTSVIGNMIAYENCSSRGTMLTTSGTGTAATHSTAASTAGTVLFQAFLYTAAGATSSYNRTLRFPGSDTYRIIGGESPGSAGNVTFSATIPSGSWGSIIIPLSV